MLAAGNKGDKSKNAGNDDEDGGDSDDKKTLMKILGDFRDQQDIVLSLFNLINEVFTVDEETPSVIVSYPQLSGLLERGMVRSESWLIRQTINERIKDILLVLHNTAYNVNAES